jgi:polyribonucleotide nucleotidyltransferase
MDIKIDGLKYEIMEAALAQARDGRLHILGKLIETLASPKEGVKTYAPKIITRRILMFFIGALMDLVEK